MNVTKDIQVWGDRFSLLTATRSERRTETLFGSELILPNNKTEQAVLTLHDRSDGQLVNVHRNEWITVRSASEEDCLKTQKYVLAVCNPEVSLEVPCDHHFRQFLFENNSKLRDRLEGDYQVVLAPSRNGVCVQGTQGAVAHVVSRLSDLVMTNSSTQGDNRENSMPLVPRSTSSSYVPAGYPAIETISNGTHDHHHQYPQPNLDQELVHRLMQNSGYLSDTIKQALIEGLRDNADNIHLASSQSSSRASSPPAYEKRIAQFIELGFPQDKIEATFESLGRDASDNDVMERLVIIHPPQERTPVPRPVSTAHVADRSPPQPTPLSRDGPRPSPNRGGGLRPIIIDGSNVAMKHGNGKVFSCRGILLAVQWFQERNHKDITIFVPAWRKEPTRPEHPIIDQQILLDLEKANLLKFTPSRRIGNRRIVCYDDRFIVQLASDKGGVILSNDNFRDLMEENPSWRETIENQLLMFVFVGDTLMIPSDPLGRQGPSLNDMLSFENRTASLIAKEMGRGDHTSIKEPCPYKERCTFGPRCRFYHPEREASKETERPSEDHSTLNKSPSHGDYNDLTNAMQQLSLRASPSKMAHPMPHPPPPEGLSPGVPHHVVGLGSHPGHTGDAPLNYPPSLPYAAPFNNRMVHENRRIEELAAPNRRTSRTGEHIDRHASSPNLYPPYPQPFPPSSYSRSHTHPILMVPPSSSPSPQYPMDPHRMPYTSLSPDGSSRPRLQATPVGPPRPHSAHNVGVHGIHGGGGYVPRGYYEQRDTMSSNYYYN